MDRRTRPGKPRRAGGDFGAGLEVREPSQEEVASLASWPDGTLPPEWLAWADEPHRVLVAAEGAQLVGAVHVAVVGRTEGWLEGLRVVEEGRRQEAEDRLVAAALEVLHGYGVGAVRTACPVGPTPQWVARAGFVEVARFVVRLAPEDLAPGGSGRPAGAAEVAPAAERLARALRERDAGLVPLGWRWRAFGPEMARAAAREGRLLVDPAGGAALALRRGPDRLVAALAADEPAGLLATVRSEVGGGGRLACFLPQGCPEVLAVAAWPAHPWCPEGVVVYELSGRR